jgi:hypothetical protein
MTSKSYLEADLELSLPIEEDEEQGRHAIHFVVVLAWYRRGGDCCCASPPTFHIEQLFPQAGAVIVVPLVNDTFLETHVVKVSLMAPPPTTLFQHVSTYLLFFHSSTDSKTFLLALDHRRHPTPVPLARRRPAWTRH